MNCTKIKETCLYISDLEEAKWFYHDVLGLPIINYLPGKHLFLRAGASVLLCFNPQDSRMKDSPPGHFAEGPQHLAFEVPLAEYENQKNELIRKKIAIIDEVTWESGRKSFYFRDPSGNVLEIVPDSGVWD
jgi:catechol 2,3-dioxygenase-like lactoylglutathione lyase family enzyme